MVATEAKLYNTNSKIQPPENSAALGKNRNGQRDNRKSVNTNFSAYPKLTANKITCNINN